MSSKHKLFEGAMVLTAAGFASRIMGFFFRIFLSHAFGEENVGLYQLVFPVYALCLALSTSGIQTAVSHMTAEKTALKKNTEARSILGTALGLTLLISFAEILFIQKNAAFNRHVFSWRRAVYRSADDHIITRSRAPLYTAASAAIISVCRKQDCRQSAS